MLYNSPLLPDMNSFQTLDNLMDVDQAKEDTKIFPEDRNGNIYDFKCNNKDAHFLPSDNNSTIWEAPGQDSRVDVKETEIAVDLCYPASPARSPDIKGADGDYKVQSCSDRSGMEHELSVSPACCTEADDTAVKDICVDEGLPLKVKPLPKDIADESIEKSRVDVEWLVPKGLKSLTNHACEKDFNDLKVIHHNELVSDMAYLALRDLPKQNGADMVTYEDIHTEDTLVKPSSTVIGCGDEVEHPDVVCANGVAGDNCISSRSIPETSAKGETSELTLPLPETDTLTSPAANNIHKEELHVKASHPPVLQTAQIPESQKLAADQVAASARFKRDHLESSFASVGPISGSVTYSGPIAYSGSLSHRSDASSVSTRSFAFPVLQNEWNFSPVRLQKADRRHLGRHRGWMHGLFCCKF